MASGIYYLKAHYYSLKHKVFNYFNYRCSCCNSSQIEDLELHHADDLIWNGHGGRDRYLKAVKVLEQAEGDDHKLELLCSGCHELRDLGIPIDFIHEHLEGRTLCLNPQLKDQIKTDWYDPEKWPDSDIKQEAEAYV